MSSLTISIRPLQHQCLKQFVRSVEAIIFPNTHFLLKLFFVHTIYQSSDCLANKLFPHMGKVHPPSPFLLPTTTAEVNAKFYCLTFEKGCLILFTIMISPWTDGWLFESKSSSQKVFFKIEVKKKKQCYMFTFLVSRSGCLRYLSVKCEWKK